MTFINPGDLVEFYHIGPTRTRYEFETYPNNIWSSIENNWLNAKYPVMLISVDDQKYTFLSRRGLSSLAISDLTNHQQNILARTYKIVTI